MSETPEFEEMEQIPWSALAARNPRPVPLPILIVGGLAVIVVAGFLLLQLVPDGGPGTGADPGASDEPSARSIGAGASALTSTSTAGAAPPDSPAVYSEADLMAIAVEDETALAVMQAEWFVRDFFTVDGDPATAARLRRLLGEDVELPHEAPSAYSYVEWVQAYAADSSQPGLYVVDVAYRLLSSGDGADYTRAPVAAVQVPLAVDVDGVTTLRNLPSPVDPPPMVAPSALPDHNPVPDAVVAAARRSAPEVELAGAVGSRVGDGWELQGALPGPGGNLWPVLVHVAGP